MDTKLMLSTFRNVILASAYIFGISQFMNHAERIFGGTIDKNLAPFVFLLLFCLSAAVVGSLVFGQAVMLSLENKKTEGVKSAIYSVGWLFLITVVAIAILIIAR